MIMIIKGYNVRGWMIYSVVEKGGEKGGSDMFDMVFDRFNETKMISMII